MTQRSPLQLLDKNHLLDVFGQKQLQRAEAYVVDKRVQDYDIESDGSRIHSEVAGTDYYTQQINLIDFGEQYPNIIGRCSCPVGFNCKHVAAVLLTIMEQPFSEDPNLALTLWQNRLLKLRIDRDIEDRRYRDTQMMYQLQICDHNGASLSPQQALQSAHYEVRLQPVKSRRLKSGDWGKGSRIPLDSFTSDWNYDDYLQDGDRQLGRMMVNMANLLEIEAGYDAINICNDGLPLHGDDGNLILRRALESQRCYLLKVAAEQLLSIGQPLTLHTEWHDNQLQIHLEQPLNWLLIPTSPPCYLNIDDLSIGQLKTPLPGPEIQLLQQIPTFDHKQARQLSHFIKDLYGDTLPPPVDIQYQIIDTPARPKLVLNPQEPDHHGQPMVSFGIVYGPLEIDPYFGSDDNPLMLSDEQQDYQLQRDLDLEEAAIEALQEMGFFHVRHQHNDVRWKLSASTRRDSAERWHNLLEDVFPTLVDEHDWIIEIKDNFAITIDETATFSGSIEGNGDWFDLGLNIEIGDEKVPLLPLIQEWLRINNTPNADVMVIEHRDNHWVRIPTETIKPVIDTLFELFDSRSLSANGQLTLPSQQAARLMELQDSLQRQQANFAWHGGKNLQELGQKLRNFDGIHPIAPPTTLKAELRDYQQEGLNWLYFLHDYQFNGILADDMGLGKTLQALALLQSLKSRRKLRKPALVVAPTSLLSNWKREAERFTPTLKTAISHGPERQELLEQLTDFNLIITSYGTLLRDLDTLRPYTFSYVILDEAQAIKNPKAQVTMAVQQLQTEHKLCITGTPLENHLGELWSQFQFLMPNFLGSEKQFAQQFRKPIERDGNLERQQILRQRLQPFMLRRNKDEVASELPPKTEIVRSIALPPSQAKLYESIRFAMEKKIQQLLSQKGLSRSHIEILDALLKMRQVCCDPRLVKLDSAKKVKQSAKLDMLMEMLPELIEEGRRILLFSQFTSMLTLIEERLKQEKIGYSKLTGQTRKRDEAISRFQDGDVPVFLISLKAGGVGLNLTEADTVIHYDPWWNPAVENQATDRAHRIGQDKPVFVYKLITENTVEEKIMALQAQKQALADAVYDGGAQREQGLQADELLALFSTDVGHLDG